MEFENQTANLNCDPLKHCECGFRRKCDAHAKGFPALGAVEFRSDNYRKINCAEFSLGQDPMVADPGNKDQPKLEVDHIIEIWEVSRAFYRAAAMFDSWKGNFEAWRDKIRIEMKDIYPRLFEKDESGQLVDIKWPTGMIETTSLLADMKMIFNTNNNLCLIPAGFNSKKNKFLMSHSTTIKPDELEISDFLVEYYNSTIGGRTRIGETLDKMFGLTSNVMYWAVARILEEDYKEFLAQADIQDRARRFGHFRLKVPSVFAQVESKAKQKQIIDEQVDWLEKHCQREGLALDENELQSLGHYPQDFVYEIDSQETLLSVHIMANQQLKQIDDLLKLCKKGK